MKHDLVDEYRLLIHPLVLGNSKRRYPGDSAPLLSRVGKRRRGTAVPATP